MILINEFSSSGIKSKKRGAVDSIKGPGFDGYESEPRLQEAIDLLKLLQSDYQGATGQLEKLARDLREKEAVVNQRLQSAVMASAGLRTLSLVSSVAEGSQMGRSFLAGITSPRLPQLMSLKIYCLGRFEVGSPWQQIDRWQSAKSRSVFQYLVSRPREPVVKDIFMETLWPDCEPQAANNNLKAAIHGLRRVLSQLFHDGENFPYILFSQGKYLINPDIELWTDVEEFEKRWAHGRRLEREGNVTEAVREFEEAAALYRGDYLEEEPYENWTLLRREALKDIYLIILGKLADHSMETADYEGCIIFCQKILDKDPCREDAYRRLMCCYSRLGRRNRAMRWYQICRHTINAELDTAPDSATTNMYQRLLKNEPI
jgi:DNA-binding SARP family transcriptional activator